MRQGVKSPTPWCPRPRLTLPYHVERGGALPLASISRTVPGGICSRGALRPKQMTDRGKVRERAPNVKNLADAKHLAQESTKNVVGVHENARVMPIGDGRDSIFLIEAPVHFCIWPRRHRCGGHPNPNRFVVNS